MDGRAVEQRQSARLPRLLSPQESERRQQDLIAELQEACERKDRFMAILSHELRNMLAPIVTALDVYTHTRTDDADCELIRIAAHRTRELSRLIDDLFDASRLMLGKVQLRRERIDLCKIVERSLQAVTPAINERSQQLQVRQHDAPLWLDADPLRLEQVFLNLLSNAVKYTPPGGTIWVELTCEDGTALFQVRDSGCGIRPEQIPSIFEFFSQADGSHRHGQGGCGIGLALVKSLVEMHGGAVKAHSDGPGTGADFTVRLPVLDLPF